MGDIIGGISSIILIMIIFVLPGYFAFTSRRTINNLWDKTFICLVAEYSFLQKPWSLNSADFQKSQRVKIPWRVTWAGAIRPVFDTLGAFVFIWWALSCLLAGLIVVFGKQLFGQLAVDMFFPLSFFIIVVACFLFHYRSVASELSEIEEKSSIATDFLLKAGWDNINSELIDILYAEIKTDFEWYRKDTGIGGIILLLISTSIFYLGEKTQALPIYASISLLLLVSSIMASKWLHETYRTKVLRIALSALSEIKKRRLLESQTANNVFN